MYMGINLYVAAGNAYGIKAGTYYFAMDGRMLNPVFDTVVTPEPTPVPTAKPTPTPVVTPTPTATPVPTPVVTPEPTAKPEPGDKEGAIVKENGKLYYVIDGVKQNCGLFELDGEYYYAHSYYDLAANQVVYLSQFNGLIDPGPGYFGFDADGKLIKTGLIKASSGLSYYYEDLVRASGLTKIGNNYYYFNETSGYMYMGISLWVSGNNPYGIKEGTYYFAIDGRMILY